MVNGFIGYGNRICGPNPDAVAKTTSALYSQLVYVADLMRKAGFPATPASGYALAQMMMESGWMGSNLANTDNNYSGIIYLNKPYQDATKGIPDPEGGFYAHYKDFSAWAKDFLRILKMNKGSGRPIDATSPEDYVNRLIKNGYSTNPDYGTPFNAALKKVTDAFNFGTGQDKAYKEAAAKGEDTFTVSSDTPEGVKITSNEVFDTEKTLNDLSHKIERMPMLEKIGIGLLALFTLKMLFSK